MHNYILLKSLFVPHAEAYTALKWYHSLLLEHQTDVLRDYIGLRLNNKLLTHESLQHLNTIYLLSKDIIYNNNIRYIPVDPKILTYSYELKDLTRSLVLYRKYAGDSFIFDIQKKEILLTIQYKTCFNVVPYKDSDLIHFKNLYDKNVNYIDIGFFTKEVFNDQTFPISVDNFFKKTLFDKEYVKFFLMELKKNKELVRILSPSISLYHDVNEYAFSADNDKIVFKWK